MDHGPFAWHPVVLFALCMQIQSDEEPFAEYNYKNHKHDYCTY